ncbi:acyl carrier protein [Streptomyces althioticus]|uniref:acyl carrier protein n=1 Tax=Streptomyces althioticus TaxID=83380 RepID=UPI003EC0FE3E
MTQDTVREQLIWLQRLFAEKMHMEVEASDRPVELGLDSVSAVLVGSEIRRRYDVPLRVSWEWLMTLTTQEIATQLAAADRRHGAHEANS